MNKSKISKRGINIISIVLLVIFMLITNFTTSVTRACTMGIIGLLANLFYKKQDSINSIAISMLISLIINPFIVYDIGFKLTYLGTLGIILFNKNIEKILYKKLNKKLAKILSVTISAQIAIFPISAYIFNTISLTFFISNILVSFILAPIIILGFITIVISFISFKLAKLLAIVLNLLLELLSLIASFISKIPFSKLMVVKPYLISIILIYLLSLIFNYIYIIYNSKRVLRRIEKKIIKLIKSEKFKSSLILTITSILFLNIIYSIIIPKSLRVHFVDVMQGDSSFIITPKNKNILIDGGEENNDTLLSYLLARRVKKIDYIIISHFDDDHIGGLFSIMEELDVKNIIIGKQPETSENLERFLEITKAKKIKIIVAEAETIRRMNIEKDLYLEILWPNSKNIINENVLNNNSLVCKLCYKNFSILFTGDIEKQAEKTILQEYRENLQILNSTILKVAHHGSNTSSTIEFIDAVKPKIALIGVGENNKFGHPNKEVIERLKAIRNNNL